jgi:hypothetical protein
VLISCCCMSRPRFAWRWSLNNDMYTIATFFEYRGAWSLNTCGHKDSCHCTGRICGFRWSDTGVVKLRNQTKKARYRFPCMSVNDAENRVIKLGYSTRMSCLSEFHVSVPASLTARKPNQDLVIRVSCLYSCISGQIVLIKLPCSQWCRNRDTKLRQVAKPCLIKLGSMMQKIESYRLVCDPPKSNLDSITRRKRGRESRKKIIY